LECLQDVARYYYSKIQTPDFVCFFDAEEETGRLEGEGLKPGEGAPAEDDKKEELEKFW